MLSIQHLGQAVYSDLGVTSAVRISLQTATLGAVPLGGKLSHSLPNSYGRSFYAEIELNRARGATRKPRHVDVSRAGQGLRGVSEVEWWGRQGQDNQVRSRVYVAADLYLSRERNAMRN